MNKEFAIEPTAFENALQLKYVLEKFGFHQGRFIVGFPSAWISQVYEHFKSFPDLEQARASALLKKAKDNNLVLKPGGIEYMPSFTWIDNTHRVQVDSNPFDGVIAAVPNSFGFPTVHEVDDSFFGVSHDSRIVGTAENYVKVAKRLLQMSHEMTIVDPYLRLEKPERAKVIKNFLEIALQGKCRSFVIWARYTEVSMKTEEAYKCMLVKQFQQDLGTTKAKLEVKLVDDDHSKGKMHPRLLLSSLGGLRFDHGFQEFNDARKVDVSLLSQEVHIEHYRWYIDPNSKNDFKIMEEHYISG